MHSKKGLAAAFITLSLLVPAFASATSKPSSKDTTPPVISAVSDKAAESPTGIPVAVSYAQPTATDAKDGTVAVSCAPASGSSFTLGSTVVTCSAKDAAGNKAQKTFKVAVKDTTPPKPLSIHIGSSNANAAQAKAGDTVTLSVTLSEKATPLVLVETKQLFVKAKNTSGNVWDASYAVSSKDPKGRVDYLLTLVDDAKNVYICSSVRLPLIGYCPTTDGSSVTVVKETAPPPASDVTPPVIAPHADVSVTTEGASAQVTYALPTAADAKDGAVPVSCSPASGSMFDVGTTTVTCSARDAAGNTAQSSFKVIVTQEVVVPPEPTEVVLASQEDESYLCGENTGTWRACEFTPEGEPGPGMTLGLDSSAAVIHLGQGSGDLSQGALQSVTIANRQDSFHSWIVSLACFADAAYTEPCSDWDNASAPASQTTDGKHWTADFSGAPMLFLDTRYYQLVIDDTDSNWTAPAYGSRALLAPYYVIKGLTQ